MIFKDSRIYNSLSNSNEPIAMKNLNFQVIATRRLNTKFTPL